jgi:hypothetical protein
VLDRKEIAKDIGEDHHLLGIRHEAKFTPDEERFSVALHDRVEELLRGRRNELPLLRKYRRNESQLGVMPTPPEIDRQGLRLPVVEHMLLDTLLFLHDGTAGSPPSRARDAENRIVETQRFTTKWPHIVLLRTDVFDEGGGEALETTWTALRFQNQNRQIRLNRLLDLAAIGLEVLQLAVFRR